MSMVMAVMVVAANANGYGRRGGWGGGAGGISGSIGGGIRGSIGGKHTI